MSCDQKTEIEDWTVEYKQQQQVVEMVAVSVLGLLLLAIYKCQGQPYPFMNTSLSFEDRVKVIEYSFGSDKICVLVRLVYTIRWVHNRIWLDG